MYDQGQKGESTFCTRKRHSLKEGIVISLYFKSMNLKEHPGSEAPANCLINGFVG